MKFKRTIVAPIAAVTLVFGAGLGTASALSNTVPHTNACYNTKTKP